MRQPTVSMEGYVPEGAIIEYEEQRARERFEEQTREQEREARRKFQTELLIREQEERQRFQQRIRKLKKVYRRRYGSLEGFSRWRRREEKRFQAGLSSWKTATQKKFLHELKAWKVTAKGKFEKELERWKSQTFFEIYIKPRISTIEQMLSSSGKLKPETYEAPIDITLQPTPIHISYRYVTVTIPNIPFKPLAMERTPLDITLHGSPSELFPTVETIQTYQPSAKLDLNYMRKMWQMEEQRWRTRYYEREAESYWQRVTLNYLEKMGQMEEQRWRTGYYEKTAPQQFQESMQFYTQLGEPKLAGRYEPFEIPEGYTVKAVAETPEGLQVTFMQPQEVETEPIGLAETIMKWQVPSLNILETVKNALSTVIPQPEHPEVKLLFQTEPKHPLAPVAGVIASFESPIYTVGRLLGFKTPRPPPTFTGGLIGSMIQTGMAGGLLKVGWQSTEELKQVEQYGSEYTVGSIIGDIWFSYLLTKTAQVASKGVSKTVPVATRIIKKAGSITTEKIVKPTAKVVLGEETYLYYKSVAYPTFRHITIPYYKTAVTSALQELSRPSSILAKKIVGEEVYSLVKTVWIPNITQPQKVLSPTISYWIGYLPKITVPSVSKPLPVSMLKTVWLPNITQPQKVLAPTIVYWKGYLPEITVPAINISKPLPLSMMKTVYLPNITQPQKLLKPTITYLYERYIGFYPKFPVVSKPLWYLEAKAFTKVSIGKFRYSLTNIRLPTLSFDIAKPEWYLETKAYGKTVMGKIRFTFRLPTPTQTYKPIEKFWFPKTSPKNVSKIVTVQLAKSTVSTTVKPFVITPVLKLVPTQKSKKEKKKTKIVSPTPFAWKGAPYPFMKTKPWGKLKLPKFPLETVKVEPVRIAMAVKVKPKRVKKGKRKPKLTPIFQLNISELEKTLMHQTPFLEEKVRIKGLQKQAQRQKQAEKKKLRLRLKQRKRKAKKKPAMFPSEWYFKKHPLPSPTQLTQLFYGSRKTKRRKKKK